MDAAPAKSAPRGVLLDIEGTTSSIRFVHEVLFPFARRELVQFLNDQWNEDEVRQACECIACDAGAESFDAWCGRDVDLEGRRRRVCEEVCRLMDVDAKATGLKQLQGLIWRRGYEAGTLVSHVYEDVPAALAEWRERRIDIRIYSSGSVAAQKLFFGHTERGDLLPFFSGHYDTTVGPKRVRASYDAIAADMRMPPAELVFFSDIPEELDAASAAGMQTRLVIRPGNAPTTDARHRRIERLLLD